MTYCLAIKVDEGLVFAADTRTSAGVDDVRIYNKLHPIELEDRVFVILSAGNLATSQAVLATIKRDNPTPASAIPKVPAANGIRRPRPSTERRDAR